MATNTFTLLGHVDIAYSGCGVLPSSINPQLYAYLVGWIQMSDRHHLYQNNI
ncbi:hypothetical protein DSO57_1011163 [Entomophthora muscae]|uniref:Uncharacterized protein n=1 Tax=Entomophthora muscae TaxID=34485 RepID=A0ACC2TGY5_9FUNG|nr:hypothetical protein DSO57_1011163 [Entomophthora muscae]